MDPEELEELEGPEEPEDSEDSEDSEEPEEPEEGLSPRQQALYEAYEAIVVSFGLFTQDDGADGAHYMSEKDNPFVDRGLICANCVFYEGGQQCEIVEGQIHPLAICKLWVINEELLDDEVEKASYSPPDAVRAAAKRALGWIADGKAGDGFTATGRYRAETLAAGQSVSGDTVRRMRSYFARHEVDKKAEGFHQGEKGFPSAGRVAWDAWGGDAGKSWVNSLNDDVEKKKFSSRSEAGRYAATVRWGRGRSIDATRTDEVGQSDWGQIWPRSGPTTAENAIANLQDGRHVAVYSDQIPEITDRLLAGDGKENIRNLQVENTPYFDDHGTMIERSKMPQVPSNRKQEFLTDIEKQGLTVTRERVSPRNLKPIQSEINGKSSAEIRQREATRGTDAFKADDKLAIIVSSDGYIMDGHHRWAAAALHDLNGFSTQLSVIRVGAPRDALMGVMQAWTDAKGVKRLGFGEERPRSGVGKQVGFIKSCDMAILAQKEFVGA